MPTCALGMPEIAVVVIAAFRMPAPIPKGPYLAARTTSGAAFVSPRRGPR
jgi:hypothetical protein